MSSSSSRKSALQQLKEAKLGFSSRTTQFNQPDEKDIRIYDEVDEDQYREIKRSQMIADSHSIIGDSGFNYITGMNDSDDQDTYQESDSEDTFSRNRDNPTHAKKRSANENDLKSNLSDQSAKKRKHILPFQPTITSAFAKADTKAAIHAHVKASASERPKHSAKEDDDFMNDLLSDFNSPTSTSSPAGLHTKRAKHICTPRSFISSGNQSLSHSSSSSLTSVFRSIPDPDCDPPLEESTSFTAALPECKSEPGTVDDHVKAEIVDNQFVSVPDPVPQQRPTVKKVSTTKPKTKLIDLDIPKFPEDPFVIAPAATNETTHSQTMHQRGTHVVSPYRILESDGSTLSMYFLDAAEANGVVYLFGKILVKGDLDGGSYWSSCCIVVKNIERNVFFLPRQVRHVKTASNEYIPTDQPLEIVDVYNEIECLRSQFQVGSMAMKVVQRQYVFHVPNVPETAEWLKMCYMYSSPAFPSNLQGETFSHVFGTNTNALELMVLKWKLMGPCWIVINQACEIGAPQLSWAKFECLVTDPKTVRVSKDQSKPAPPITAMSLTLQTRLNAKSEQEVLLISALTWQVSIDQSHSEPIPLNKQVFVRPPVHGTKLLVNSNDTQVMTSERAMLSRFLQSLFSQDPDVLIGHNIFGFDIDILAARFKKLNLHVNEWSKLGRLRRTNFHTKPGTPTSARTLVSGRLVLDTWLASKEFLGASKSYALNYLAEDKLKIEPRTDLDRGVMNQYFESAAGIQYLIQYSVQDCMLVTKLMSHLNALVLYKQLANICGHVLSRVMAGGRAERNEFLLLHEFHSAKYIVPDKYSHSSPLPKGDNRSKPAGRKMPAPVPVASAPTHASAEQSEAAIMDEYMTGMDFEHEELEDSNDMPVKSAHSTKPRTANRKPKYLGGLVLEPKRGFYESFVMLLDFNSLYPSIIQEYNICFTTVSRTMVDESTGLPPLPSLSPPGILPRIIKTLVNRRWQVKSLMKSAKNASEANQYNTRQLALKLTANSMYGCLGFVMSRFHCQPLAALITRQGREILQATVEVAKNNGMQVIYGDTDSIMIHVDTQELADVHKMAKKLKDLINKQYRCLEIELDGVFERMLLLKKKKYAAVLLEGDLTNVGKAGVNVDIRRKLEVKGLDVVRRDWCGLSHHVSEYVLNQILMACLPRDQVVEMIHDFLIKTASEVREGKVPLDLFVINKGLTKRPQEYTESVIPPHVHVALAMEARGEPVHVGGTVPYVISAPKPTDHDKHTFSNPSSGNLALRAYHPAEFVQNNELCIDVEWYLSQQVLPPLLRLCEVIEGTDRAQLITKLGLDPKLYSSGVSRGDSEQANGDDVQRLEAMLTDEERFASAERLVLRCEQCGPFKVHGLTLRSGGGSDVHSVNWTCPTCHVPLPLAHVGVQLTTQIRKHVQLYEQLRVQCTDPVCQHHTTYTRAVRVYGKCPAWPVCANKVVLVYTAHQLYCQLAYFASLFDSKRALKSELVAADGVHALMTQDSVAVSYTRLLEVVMAYLNLNDRTQVDLARLFSFMNLGAVATSLTQV